MATPDYLCPAEWPRPHWLSIESDSRRLKENACTSLRKLEANSIVLCKDLSDLVLHVEYELRSDLHQSIFAIVDQLSLFGGSFFEEQDREKKLPNRANVMGSDAD